MSPRRRTERPGFPALRTATAPVQLGTLAPFERKVSKLRSNLGEGLGSLEPKLRFGVDRSSQSGDPVSDSARILKQVFGQHQAMITAQ